jgi:hypothetical protein
MQLWVFGNTFGLISAACHLLIHPNYSNISTHSEHVLTCVLLSSHYALIQIALANWRLSIGTS